MNKKILFLIIPLIAACAGKEISPKIKEKQGVEYGIGDHGYPVIQKVIFNITKTDVIKSKKCIKQSVDFPESDVIQDNEKLQVSGRSSFYAPRTGNTLNYRYTLMANSKAGVYAFERLYYSTDAGMRTHQVMANKYWNPESLYSDLSKIVSSIDSCLN